MQEKKTLTVSLICSDLSEWDDYPKGPCLVLTGSVDSVRGAASLYGQDVILAVAHEEDSAPDWTETARHMLETWDYWFSGAPGGDDKKAEVDRLARAACFAAEGYCDAMGGIGADGAPGVLMRTFLLALIDPMSPDLDHLRVDPAAADAARAKQEQP